MKCDLILITAKLAFSKTERMEMRRKREKEGWKVQKGKKLRKEKNEEED